MNTVVRGGRILSSPPPRLGRALRYGEGTGRRQIKATASKSYSLDVVPAGEVKDRSVGSCEGGAKKIVYSAATHTEAIRRSRWCPVS